MKQKLSHWQHALISTAIFITVIAACFFILFQPVMALKKDNLERIDNLKFQLSKLSHAESQIELLKNEMLLLNENEDNNADFLQGEAPAIVAASLQKKLKTIVESSGGNLVSTHAITGKDDDVYPKVTIKVHMQVDMQALQAVIFSLTTSKPLLFTDNLLIQRRHTSARRKNKNTGLLEVRFDVTGYLNQAIS